MREIKMVSGAYGYRSAKQVKGEEGEIRVSRLVTAKTPKDPPFPVTDEEAARLVALGVAEYYAKPEPGTLNTGVATGLNGTEKPEYNAGMSAVELRALLVAAQPGIKLKANTPKTVMVELLDAFYAVDESDGDAGEDDDPDPDDDLDTSDGDEDDGEKLPTLGAEEPVT